MKRQGRREDISEFMLTAGKEMCARLPNRLCIGLVVLACLGFAPEHSWPARGGIHGEPMRPFPVVGALGGTLPASVADSRRAGPALRGDDAWAIHARAPAGVLESPLRVLMIGNSFTRGSFLPLRLWRMATTEGKPTYLAWSAPSGYSLQRHRRIPESVGLVDEGDWDVVILQEFSTRPTDGLGRPGRFKKDATWWYDRVKTSSPSARVILYETWARHADHEVYPRSFRSPLQMQRELRRHYADCASEHIPRHRRWRGKTLSRVEVAPVGEAWLSHVRSEHPRRLHHTDLYHAGPSGAYLSALVLYGSIYRAPVIGVDSQEFTPDLARHLQRTARDAMRRRPSVFSSPMPVELPAFFTL